MAEEAGAGLEALAAVADGAVLVPPIPPVPPAILAAAAAVPPFGPTPVPGVEP